MVFEAVTLRPPVVLLDANLLYPFRNLLVQFAVERLIDVRWTDAIQEEWVGNLVAEGRVTRERLMRTLEIMRRALPVRREAACVANSVGRNAQLAGQRPARA